jgi:hypothetical protein
MQLQLRKNESLDKETKDSDHYFCDFSSKLEFIRRYEFDLKDMACPDITEERYLFSLSPKIEQNFWNPLKHHILCDTLDHAYSPKKDPKPPTPKPAVKHEESVSETVDSINEPDTGKKKKRRRRKKNKKNKSNVQESSNHNSGSSRSDHDLASNQNESKSNVPPKEKWKMKDNSPDIFTPCFKKLDYIDKNIKEEIYDWDEDEFEEKVELFIDKCRCKSRKKSKPKIIPNFPQEWVMSLNNKLAKIMKRD